MDDDWHFPNGAGARARASGANGDIVYAKQIRSVSGKAAGECPGSLLSNQYILLWKMRPPLSTAVFRTGFHQRDRSR